MKNKKKNHCKQVIGDILYKRDTYEHYTCKFFLKDQPFMSECSYHAMGKCTNGAAQNEAKYLGDDQCKTN